jgi:hypothetical protein
MGELKGGLLLQIDMRTPNKTICSKWYIIHASAQETGSWTIAFLVVP